MQRAFATIRQTILLSIILLALEGCSPGSVDSSKKVAMESPFQSLIDSVYAHHPNAKGIIMHVEAPDQGISWNGAVGIADKTSNRALKPNDPVLIASITKTYVGACILRLVEQGEISLNQSIKGLLSDQTDSVMLSGGYNLDALRITHLISNTSGIYDYCSAKTYLDRTTGDPSYQWTRDEQIALAMKEGEQVLEPGTVFSYSETNFLLLAEIIERQTGKSFPQAVRELLKYKEFGLGNTWFPIQEEAPKELAPLVHQYATSLNVDSYMLHPSFDLYGGGGIASTAQDLALFSQLLFTGKVFDHPGTKDLLYTEVKTADGQPVPYRIGIMEFKLGKQTTFGHGGFWGTMVQYIPELNASIAVFVLERDEWELNLQMIKEVANHLDRVEKVPSNT